MTLIGSLVTLDTNARILRAEAAGSITTERAIRISIGIRTKPAVRKARPRDVPSARGCAIRARMHGRWSIAVYGCTLAGTRSAALVCAGAGVTVITRGILRFELIHARTVGARAHAARVWRIITRNA